MPTRRKRSDRENFWDGGYWCVGKRNGLEKRIQNLDAKNW